MVNLNLNNLTISKVRELLVSGDLSCRDLVGAYQKEIQKSDKDIGAYLEVFDDALEMAVLEDNLIKGGATPKALSGIPFAIKDNILIKGKKATAASKILEPYVASYDSFVISRLRKAGAIFLGRTNMDEFAMGSSCENSAYGITKNPHDLSRVPGGSSGGSASAVASNQCFAALGSDTAGSIREPASFCGVVGMKPTYGTVSRSGLMAMACSLDQIGPLTRSVEDAKIIFEVIRGKDAKDSTSVEYKPSKLDRKPVIGVPKEYFSLNEGGKEGVDSDVAEITNNAIKSLKSEGYEIKEVSLPHTKYALSCYYIIMPAEVSSNLARFDGVRYGLQKDGKKLFDVYDNTRGEGFGEEVRRRIILGTYVLSAGYYDAYYARAQKVRTLIKRDFEEVFRDVDALLTPTVPTPAFKIGEKSQDPISMYLSDLYTAPTNLAGLPAISVPYGSVERDGKFLPVGVQVIVPWFAEDTLFDLGEELEKIKP